MGHVSAIERAPVQALYEMDVDAVPFNGPFLNKWLLLLLLFL